MGGAADPVCSGKLSTAASLADHSNTTTFILIVTPTYNSEQFLDDTILSVVSQSGDFYLRYHIQDGGSNDATMKIVRHWDRLLRSGDFPILCAGLTFSFDSNPDAGMYQAINRGVAQARPSWPFLMGWINSDDRLAPGALAAIHGIYEQFPEVSFTCARVSIIDQHGVITGINLPVVYDRQKLSEGLHDGRSHSFVMQEGTFWRSGLWDQVGGLDEQFRLAGDWNLWCRFACHAALFTIDSVLGFHRRHDKQLSADLKPYHAEIDAAGQQMSVTSFPVLQEVSGTLKFNLDNKRWEKTRQGTLVGTPIVHFDGEGAVATRRIELTSGARFPEGPYPEINLPGGMRWIDEASAEAVVTVPYPGLWRMHLRIRNWRPDLRLLVRRGSTVCLDVMPRAGEDESDTLLFASLWLEGGPNDIGIDTKGEFDLTSGWLFILLEWYVIAPATSDRAYLAPHYFEGNVFEIGSSLPTISVVICSSIQKLDLRLDAILKQEYPQIDICVVDDGCSVVNRQILAAYAPLIDRVVTLDDAHRHLAIGHAIDLSSGTLIIVLDDTATLATGALFALAGAFRQDWSFDLAVGITVDEIGSVPMVRRLPSLADGSLSMRNLLQFGLHPEGFNLFDRGALFFTRDIWQASGGHLMAATFSCAAFDFWVRCAKIGAMLRTVPVDLIHKAIDLSRQAETRRPDLNDVRSHAEMLAQENNVALGRVPSATMRLALKIVMHDAEGIGEQPSAGCRRLATTLAAANQRVTCIVKDKNIPNGEQPSEANLVFQAVAIERPELVVIVGDKLSESSLEVVTRLTAANIPTINVRERLVHIENLQALKGSDHGLGSRAASCIDLSLPGDWVVAEPYGALVYGKPSVRAEPEPSLDYHKQILRGLRAGIDPSVYKPYRRTQARRVLGLPVDAFIVLTVADHPTQLSVNLAIAVEAYDKFDCAAKLMLILGYSGELPSIDAPIRQADDQSADDVHALFYAAANVLVSPLGEDTELPLVQAAASGTPTIVKGGDHDGDTIREGPFGLRLPAWTTALLGEGLRRLFLDRGLHRQLSWSGLAHTQENYSLAACAWSFMTLLGKLHGFRRLRPALELQFPVIMPLFSIRPLHTVRARPFLIPTWQIACSRESHRDGVADCTGIDLSGKAATLYLRARHGGPQRLLIRAASRDGTLVVTVSVNGTERATLEYNSRDGGFDLFLVHGEFFCGLNRIDLVLASSSASSSACLMIRSLDLEEDLEVIGAEHHPRSWQPLIGFAQVDQIDGEGAPSQWIDGRSATLRLWSNEAGTRHLSLLLNNYEYLQWVEVAVNGKAIATIKVPTTDFLKSTATLLKVTVKRGWSQISLTTHNFLAVPEFGSTLRMLVTDIRFIAIDAQSSLDEDGLSQQRSC